MEKLLLDEKQSSTSLTSMPRFHEEMMAMKWQGFGSQGSGEIHSDGSDLHPLCHFVDAGNERLASGAVFAVHRHQPERPHLTARRILAVET